MDATAEGGHEAAAAEAGGGDSAIGGGAGRQKVATQENVGGGDGSVSAWGVWLTDLVIAGTYNSVITMFACKAALPGDRRQVALL